jgi:DNA-binding NarL/FixJ family response regulator
MMDTWPLAGMIAAGAVALVGAGCFLVNLLRNRFRQERFKWAAKVRAPHRKSAAAYEPFEEPLPPVPQRYAFEALPPEPPPPQQTPAATDTAGSSAQLEAPAEGVDRQLDDRDLADLQARVETKLRERIESLTALLAEADRKTEQLRTDIDAQVKQRTAPLQELLNQADQKFDELRTSLEDQAEQSIAGIKPLLEQADQRVNELRGGLQDQLAQRADSLSELLARTDQKLSELQRGIEDQFSRRSELLAESIAAADQKIEELPARIDRQFDDRVEALQQLLAQAEQRSRALRDENRDASQAIAPATVAKPAPEVRTTATEVVVESTWASPPDPKVSSPSSRQPISDPQGPREADEEPVSTPAAMSRTTSQDEVFRLAEQGLDSVEIASRLGVDIGRVELLLNLRRSAAQRPSGTPRDA